VAARASRAENAAAAPVDRRITLADGRRTTLYVARYDPERTEPAVALLGAPRRLASWCAERGIADALVGGFFVRPGGTPLGEVRTRGVQRAHMPFDDPWGRVRACVHVDGGVARIVRRDALGPAPRGDLLQAGPLLVQDGRVAYDRAADLEGFSRGARQFDSDITDGRHPRAALGVAGDQLIAVACDGRARDDAGLTLEELALVLVGLGCEAALNLDGGGSASLVTAGVLRNRPRGGYERPEHGGRPVSTALVFAHRS
jgi:hypothetical protein